MKGDDGKPGFDRRVVSTVVHEFSHSFVNPIVARHRAELEKAGGMIHDPVREVMADQAYTNWKTVLDESLVRAVTIRYQAAHSDEKAVASRIANEKARGFLWIAELSEELDRYEASRKKHGALDVFFPELVRYFKRLAPRTRSLVANYEANRPQVTALTPANGARRVDPGLREVTVTFDRPMQIESHAVVPVGRDGGARLPKIGQAGFDETGLVFTMEVELEPEKVYELSLNSGFMNAFRSRQGVPLKDHPMRFETGPNGKGRDPLDRGLQE